MKPLKIMCTVLLCAVLLTACGTKPQTSSDETLRNAVKILLSDDGITVDGSPITEAAESPVYAANDIVYYEAGKDFTYGEGTQEDAHSAEEAAAHTVVHITEPGAYRVSGKLSRGQIAVDLGKDAKENPEAVVTLILDGADITCEVAPAVIFYNVYECGSADAETASKDADTKNAGANVVLADGSVNTVRGAYVARIYEPGSVELNEDGTQVTEAGKLHKYDGAFYSKMSMNILGGRKGTGQLTITAANEGLDSEMHLTVEGGVIRIFSGNDGINTNEDGVSVTTINGGELYICVTGETGEGDGIDSNGWLVINGGTLFAAACSNSADAGIDSDMGIHITGGTVLATGHMLDRIEEGGQSYAVFSFAQKQDGSSALCLQNEKGENLFEHMQDNAYSMLVFSSPDLKPGTYSLLRDGTPLSGQVSLGHGMQGGMQPPDMPEGMERPEMPDFAKEHPPFENKEPPEGMERPDAPERLQGRRFPGNGGFDSTTSSQDFEITKGGNLFGNIA